MADSTDPTLYLYTSLTAGSSHIITATSRLETILKANKIPFRAIDCATDEKARMLWGRRSRGRKLPGLVRFGFVVGDLEQIEEWNEFGELKDQIRATDDSSSGMAKSTTPAHATSINPTGTLYPEPPVTSPPIPSNPSSRASSQGRHISISEPSAKEKERDNTTTDQLHTPQIPTSELKSTPKSPITEAPQNLLLRQLGSEAAAKAKDRKSSATKAAAVPTTNPTFAPPKSTAQTPTPASAKTSADAEAPSADPETTAGKTPALLAAEGKTKTSTDKIETIAASDISSAPVGGDDSGTGTAGGAEKSVEEKILELRRSSTQIKQPSRLSVDTPVEKSEEVLPEEGVGKEKQEFKAVEGDTKNVNPDQEAQHVGLPANTGSSESGPPAQTSVTTPSSAIPPPLVPSSPASPPQLERQRSHRGSSLEEVDKETIRKAEEAMRIQEEDGEDDDEVDVGKEREDVEKMEEKILKKRDVGIGKDVGSDKIVDELERDEARDVKDDNEVGKEVSRENPQAEAAEEDGEEDVPNAQARHVDEKKETEMDKAEVPLPTAKEGGDGAATNSEVAAAVNADLDKAGASKTEVEADTKQATAGVPQDSKAKEPEEEATKTVGD